MTSIPFLKTKLNACTMQFNDTKNEYKKGYSDSEMIITNIKNSGRTNIILAYSIPILDCKLDKIIFTYNVCCDFVNKTKKIISFTNKNLEVHKIISTKQQDVNIFKRSVEITITNIIDDTSPSKLSTCSYVCEYNNHIVMLSNNVNDEISMYKIIDKDICDLYFGGMYIINTDDFIISINMRVNYQIHNDQINITQMSLHLHDIKVKS